MAKTKLNPLTDAPSKMNDLTKDFMLQYIKTKGTEADKKWYKGICAENKIERENTLPTTNGKKVSTYDFPVIRKAFAERFFPNLIKTNSYEDELNSL